MVLLPQRVTAQDAEVPPVPTEFRVAAAPGVRTVQPSAPSFCNVEFEPVPDRDVRISRLRDRVGLRTFAQGRGRFVEKWRDYHHVARFACTYPNDPNQQAWLAMYRQVLVNETGAPANLIDELLHFALTHSEPRPTLECPSLAPDRLATLIENDRTAAIRALVCGGLGSGGAEAALWWLDRAAEEESELFRVATVFVFASWDGNFTESLASGTVDTEELLTEGGEGLARWIAIRHDGKSFDIANAIRELDATELGAREKLWGKLTIHRIRRKVQTVEHGWQQLANRLPELAPMLADVPDRAFREWTEAYQQHRARIDRAFAFEDAWLTRRRSNMEGCVAPLRENFFDYVESQRPQSKDELEALARAPIGYILLAALGRCESEVGSATNTTAVRRLLENAERQRGPRLAALRAVRLAVAQAREENAEFPFRTEDMQPFQRFPGERDWAEIVDTSTDYSEGVVARVTRRGEVARITFRRDSYTRPRYRCVETNRIAEIRRDGSVSYRRNCVRAGTETITSVPEPVNVPAFAASQIRPGRHLQVFRGVDGDTASGFPLLVHDSAQQRRELAFMGISFRR